MKTFSSIDRYSKKKRGKSFLQKEAKLMRDMDELFDIFCSDNQQRRQLGKQHLLRMTDKDYEFYSDQEGPRLMKCFNIVETLTTSDVEFAKRTLGQQKLLDSSLPSENVGAGAIFLAKHQTIHTMMLLKLCQSLSRCLQKSCFHKNQMSKTGWSGQI